MFSGRDSAHVVTFQRLADDLGPKLALVEAVESHHRGRALVVEDDAAIRRLVERLLRRQSMDIETVADGRSAIERLETSTFDVMVLDLMIPELDGFGVIEYMKTHNMRVPVAVVSAVSQQALGRLDRSVVKVVISKPFDVDEFARAIGDLCQASERLRAE